jgi:hypothetical protein
MSIVPRRKKTESDAAGGGDALEARRPLRAKRPDFEGSPRRSSRRGSR